MREIKFRGKSKQDYETSIESIQKGDWVYGYYYFCRSRMCGVIKTTMQEECGGVGSGVVQVDIEVDIKTLGQFAVLKDRCDKEIYEGDICGYTDDPATFEVVFEDAAFRKNYQGWDADLPKRMIEQFEVDNIGIEIIGNIYENPELAGGTQKGQDLEG